MRSLEDKAFVSFVIENYYEIYSLNFDSAILMTAEARQMAETNGWIQQAAYASLYHGVATFLRGDYEQSLPSYLYALTIFDSLQDHRGVGRTSIELAGFYHKNGQYEKANETADQAQTAALLANDTKTLGTYYGFKMTFLMRQEKYDEAHPYMLKAFEIRKKDQDSIGLGYAYLDFAEYELRKGNLEAAQQYVDQSTAIRKLIGDDQGVAINSVITGENYFHVGQYKKAIPFFKKSIEQATPIGYTDLIRFGYDMLQQSYVKLGDYEKAYDHLQQAQVFNDSIFGLEKSKALLTLQTQYETEKKEKEIELLSVENELRAAEIINANNRFYASIGGIVLLIFIGYLVFNRYQQKQRALLAEEKAISQKLGFKSLIEGEEKERKRIAQELHDGLGQLLSTARLNVSAMEDRVEKLVTKQWENSIKLIDEAVTEVRHISHNMMPNALISIGFEAAIKEQAHIINDAQKVKVHVDLPSEKIDLPESEAIALYRVIQEILNNALKYAEAKNIWLTISNNESLSISIKDDGKGFDTNLIPTSAGIGWQNIHSRMEILNGEIRIISSPGQGSEISLKLAV
ncbi:tetratricopeptide repeat-containing sensor histidine kinase [Reichenbachiella faecimaris]|uniref:tetratricopeptide repeat-containing sensor histidine kinase n=1 Tax=Reichenbachiella faecimaris TaxID=692418 RepID=UPI0015941617|nr:ATP-binding protein [Reichenbachiella faecimaris]